MDAEFSSDPPDPDAEGTPTHGGDLVGPGTGGSPTAVGTGEPIDRADAMADPDVSALVEDLRADEPVLDDHVDEAAEQAGTGTDR